MLFRSVHKKRNDAVLLLIGQGPLQAEMEEKVKELGIENSVEFLGQRKDINELYSAMDVFAFPSLYEGLGMVLIEAQVAGCYCIASTEVPKVAKISDNIEFVELVKTSEEWAEIMLKMYNDNLNKDRNEKIISDSRYNINSEVEKLAQKYTELKK